MGIKEKALGFVKTASYALLETATEKINEEMTNRLQREQKFIENFPYKYRYIIRQNASTSVDLLFWEGLERDSYVVYDANDIPIYVTQGAVLLGKNSFTMRDVHKNIVAKIHKSLITLPIPLTKERQTCKIELPDEPTFDMETYVSFGDRCYLISKSDWKIEADNKDKEFKVFTAKGKRPLIHIYKVLSFEDLFKDKYIIGFDDESYKMTALAMTIGLDTIRFA